MTATHLSHFGLTMTGESGDTIYFEGPLAACQRMAFARGCELSDTMYRILGSDCGRAIYDITTITGYWLADQTGQHAGLIHRGRDAWTLALRKDLWQAD